MKVKDFLKLIDFENVDPESELIINNKYQIHEVINDPGNEKLNITFENPLEYYYKQKSKNKYLNQIITTIKRDGVERMNELEALNIANKLDIDFEEVKQELKDNNIKIEEI